MADVTKVVAERAVTFTANSPRADVWMRQRYGDQRVTFEVTDIHQQAMAIALEAEGRAMQPPLTFDAL